MSRVTTMVDATSEDSKASGSESRYVLVEAGDTVSVAQRFNLMGRAAHPSTMPNEQESGHVVSKSGLDEDASGEQTVCPPSSVRNA